MIDADQDLDRSPICFWTDSTALVRRAQRSSVYAQMMTDADVGSPIDPPPGRTVFKLTVLRGVVGPVEAALTAGVHGRGGAAGSDGAELDT